MVRRLRVLVIMDDTLLAEALVGYLGKLPHFQVRVTSSRALDPVQEVEAFAPEIVLVDRHPAADMLRLAAQHELRVVVVTLQEQAVTLYEVWHKEVESMQDVVALLDQSWQQQEPTPQDAEEERAMRYARITRLYPIEGQEQAVQRLLDSYLSWLSQRPGFVLGLALSPTREGNPVTRVAVWEGQGWADATALSEHALASRSQLIALTKDQAIHEEEFEVSLLEALNRGQSS